VFFLIAGGDGTICSVLNYIKTIPGWEKNNPPTAILPLGTGNDLSRSLGWGSSADEINPEAFLPEMFKNGKMELLDRWRLTIARG
jgi:diacylglycerol kinase (ATP)